MRSGTRFPIEAAFVPGRGEKGKTCSLLKASLSISALVKRKSSSASPGKPAITSAAINAPGFASLNRPTAFVTRSDLYLRRIERSVLSEPDCTGMWKWGQILGCPRIRASLSLIVSGSKEDNLKRACELWDRTRPRRSARSAFPCL